MYLLWRAAAEEDLTKDKLLYDALVRERAENLSIPLQSSTAKDSFARTSSTVVQGCTALSLANLHGHFLAILVKAFCYEIFVFDWLNHSLSF
jgi:hypothetical protein